MANPLHISKLAEQISLNMLSHKETRDFMLTQQSHTQQARDIIPLRFDTCFVAIAKQRERKKKKKKEWEAERTGNKQQAGHLRWPNGMCVL